MPKKLVSVDIGDYIFDASSKTVTFEDISNLEFKQIVSVVNLNGNLPMYENNIEGRGGVFENNVLTLNYDTTNMNDTDILQIFIWTA